jgi:hypothetical protein
MHVRKAQSSRKEVQNRKDGYWCTHNSNKMTIDEQEQHFNQFTKKMRETIFKKGNDYAGADRLSNFKLAGAITGTSGQLNCLNLIATKVARLGVLLRTREVNNESISDSILDLANYAVLLDQLESE